MAEGIKTKQDLIKALKQAKLPHSYHTILKYERFGIIPRMSERKGKDRFYTQDEINDIVKKVKAYKK